MSLLIMWNLRLSSATCSLRVYSYSIPWFLISAFFGVRPLFSITPFWFLGCFFGWGVRACVDAYGCQRSTLDAVLQEMSTLGFVFGFRFFEAYSLTWTWFLWMKLDWLASESPVLRVLSSPSQGWEPQLLTWLLGMEVSASCLCKQAFSQLSYLFNTLTCGFQFCLFLFSSFSLGITNNTLI